MDAITLVGVNRPIPPGTWVLFDGEPWRLSGYSGTGTAYICRSGMIQPEEVDATALQRLELPGVDFSRLRPLSAYPQAAQEKAIQRTKIIETLLQAGIRKESLALAASELGVSPQSAHRYANLYVVSGEQRSALIPNAFRYGVANHRLSPELEEIIGEGIAKNYYNVHRKPIQAVINYVERECTRRSLCKPSDGVIRQRIAQCPPREVDKHRHGLKKLREKHELLHRRRPDAHHPMAKIEIDHTRLNIMVRCKDDRLRRPWITIAIDDFSRAVLGFYISFDPPCWLSVALCLYRAMTNKTEWLQSYGLDYPWPCHGMAQLVQADSGDGFVGSNMDRASLDFDFTVQHRILSLPDFGGRIERVMGAAAYAMEFLPGKTFRSVTDKEDYDPAKHAVLSKDDLERYLLVFFAGLYNNKPHASLRNRTPLNRWIDGLKEIEGKSLAPQAPDPSLLMRLLPSIERRFGRQGFSWETVQYQSTELAPYVRTRNPETANGKFWLHYHPHDIRCLYLRRPGGSEWIRIPAVNLRAGPMSIWERKDINLADRRAARDKEAEARARQARGSLVSMGEDHEAVSLKEIKKRKRDEKARPPRAKAKVILGLELPRELAALSPPLSSAAPGSDSTSPDWSSLPRLSGRYL